MVLLLGILGIILVAWLRKAPNVEQLAQTVSDLQQRLDEWQRTTATQHQVEQVRDNLQNAQSTLARVDSSLQSLVAFTQQNFHPEVIDQLKYALIYLSQVQQALSDTQQTLFNQSQGDEQRHRQLVGNLQNAQEALSSLKTLLSEVSENLRSGQQQLNDALRTLQGDVSAAKGIVQTINQQVTVLKILQETASRVEKSVDRLTSILTGRRSGQAGEQIVSELLSAIPDDWLERNVHLGSGEVEFAIKMPGGFLIPLDSKFVRPDLSEKLEGNEISEELRQSLLKQVRDEIKNKAGEIAKKYLSDHRVLGFGIAAVPDSAYALCRDAVKAAAKQHKIVVVPYSLLLPYVLSLYLIAQRLGISTNLNETSQKIGTAQTALEQAKRVLENMDREITSVSNQRQRALDQVRGALRLLTELTKGEIALPSSEVQLPFEMAEQSPEA